MSRISGKYDAFYFTQTDKHLYSNEIEILVLVLILRFCSLMMTGMYWREVKASNTLYWRLRWISCKVCHKTHAELKVGRSLENWENCLKRKGRDFEYMRLAMEVNCIWKTVHACTDHKVGCKYIVTSPWVNCKLSLCTRVQLGEKLLRFKL